MNFQVKIAAKGIQGPPGPAGLLGPLTSVVGHIATFGDITGTLLQDGGALGTAALSDTSAFDAAGLAAIALASSASALSGHASLTSSVHGITVFGATLTAAASAAAATALLNAFSPTLKGLVPPSGGAGGTTYLRDDGTWVSPPGSGGVTDGDKGDIVITGGVWALDSAITLTGKTVTGGTFAGPTITGLSNPINGGDAVNKTYADTIAQGLDPKASVLVATTTNLTLSGEQTIGGVLTSSSRVLVKNQTLPAQNGIYVSGAGAWVRATDMDSWLEIPGAYVMVEQGSINADTGWMCTADAGGTLETTAINWSQFAGVGTYLAFPGLSLTGNTFAISNANLVAIMALTSSADTLPYFTGAGAAGLTTLSAFARSFLDDANAATVRGTIGAGDVVGPGSSIDTELALLSGTTGKILVGGSGMTVVTTATSSRIKMTNAADKTANLDIGITNFGALTSGLYNIAIGTNCLKLLTTATACIAIGQECLQANTFSGNIAIGLRACWLNTTGGNNTAMGINALQNNLTGGQNVAIGAQALLRCLGSSNTAVGDEAGAFILGVGQNCAFGNFAIHASCGGNNSGFGTQSLRDNTGSQNTAVGAFALAGTASTSTGGDNVAVGYNAALALTTGIQNIFIGSGCGVANTTGSNNILIGFGVTTPLATTGNYLNIGGVITGAMTGAAAVIAHSIPVVFPSYTVAGVPSASSCGNGATIYVTNESGGAVLATSDATNWRRVTDRAIIS